MSAMKMEATVQPTAPTQTQTVPIHACVGTHFGAKEPTPDTADYLMVHIIRATENGLHFRLPVRKNFPHTRRPHKTFLLLLLQHHIIADCFLVSIQGIVPKDSAIILEMGD